MSNVLVKTRTGLAWMFATGLLASLPACATMTDFVVTEPRVVPCESIQPIRWSRDDTDETIAQVREHNAVVVATCGR